MILLRRFRGLSLLIFIIIPILCQGVYMPLFSRCNPILLCEQSLVCKYGICFPDTKPVELIVKAIKKPLVIYPNVRNLTKIPVEPVASTTTSAPEPTSEATLFPEVPTSFPISPSELRPLPYTPLVPVTATTAKPVIPPTSSPLPTPSPSSPEPSPLPTPKVSSTVTSLTLHCVPQCIGVTATCVIGKCACPQPLLYTPQAGCLPIWQLLRPFTYPRAYPMPPQALPGQPCVVPNTECTAGSVCDHQKGVCVCAPDLIHEGNVCVANVPQTYYAYQYVNAVSPMAVLSYPSNTYR